MTREAVCHPLVLAWALAGMRQLPGLVHTVGR